LPDIQIRPITADEVEAAQRLLAYCFNWPSTRVNPSPLVERFTKWQRVEQTMAAFVGGEMAAYMQWEPGGMSLDGRVLPFAIAGPGGTLPEHRGVGLQVRLMRSALERMQAAGCVWAGTTSPIVALHRASGWEVASSALSYSIPGGSVRIQRPEHEGWVRRVDPGDWEPLAELYRLHRLGRNGSLVRSHDRWRSRVLGAEDPARLRDAAVWHDGERTSSGYVIYEQVPVAGGVFHRIEVVELVAGTRDAYLGLLGYLLSHNLAGEVRWTAPPDDVLAAVVDDPYRITIAYVPDKLFRVVDVPAALSQRGRSPQWTDDKPLLLRVIDALAPWNDGTWRLEPCGDDLTVASTTGPPDLVVDARCLSALFNGFIRPRQAVLSHSLWAASADALDRATAIFTVRDQPFCGDPL
jgi:predicted acetyltransferase